MKTSFYSLLILSLLSISCSIKRARSSEPVVETPPAVQEQTEAAVEPQTPAPAEAPQPTAPVVAEVQKLVAAQKADAAKHAVAVSGVDPEKSLGWLKNGNTRFMKSNLRKDGQAKKDIQKLAKGQSPHAIILSCSDSRVPPEIVFDQKLGEIFVIRTAGEVPDVAAIASIEYAVEHLGSRLIVVMGHTACGAVKAAIATIDGGDAGSPALNVLVQDIHPRIAAFKGHPSSSADVESESWANTRGIAKDLLQRSMILREKVASGEVKIKSALYHLDNGKVDFDQ
jgi:carbonic anhydrase